MPSKLQLKRLLSAAALAGATILLAGADANAQYRGNPAPLATGLRYPGSLNGNSQTRELSGTSAQAGDRFGTALATGDFNADGFDDLVVGAPGDSDEVSGAGQTYVLWGSPSGLVGNQPLAGFTQVANGENFGKAATVGNFNADAYDDLAIGSPDARGRGAVTIFLGGPAGFSSVIRRTGPLYARKFGAALAAGDLDGDGDDELFVGAPGMARWQGLWLPDAGQVFVFRGSAAGQETLSSRVRVMIGQPGTRTGRILAFRSGELLIGSLRGDLRVMRNIAAVRSGLEAGTGSWHSPPDVPGWNAFGYSLAVGRFDCHAPNLAFGMPNADPDYGHFTNAGGVIVQHRSLTDRLILGYEEEHRHARFGEQLAAGDFDGNGCTDLVVGMPYANPVGNHRHAGSATHRAGVVRILFSERRYQPYTQGHGDGRLDFRRVDLARWNLGPASYRLAGSAQRNAQLGSSFASGDFDGDGFDDIAMGAPRDAVGSAAEAGSVAVVYGGRRFEQSLNMNVPALGRNERWQQR